MEHDSPKMAPRRLGGHKERGSKRGCRVIPFVIEYGLHEAPCRRAPKLTLEPRHGHGEEES